MLAAELPGDLAPAGLIPGAGAWFQAIEDLALAALADDFDLGRLDQPIPLDRLVPTSGGTAVAAPAPGPVGHCAPLSGPDDAPVLAPGGDAGRTVWWTTGSERVAPVLVQARGLPAPDGFAAFIDGDWAGRGWSVGATPAAMDPSAAPSGTLDAIEADLLPWDREE
jgi:type VI secretion system protein ImpM